jgi:hypothetical protein
MAQALGFQRRIPAPLGFVQATHQQVHLGMQGAIRMVALLLAARALAFDDLWGHREALLPRGGSTDGSLYLPYLALGKPRPPKREVIL